MRIESVEIYDDTTNKSVMRHPGRRFPGLLLQGDTLHGLCQLADDACSGLDRQRDTRAWAELNQLRNALQDYRTHYKQVLSAHDLPLPFSEQDDFNQR
jgi:hypothetical protein